MVISNQILRRCIDECLQCMRLRSECRYESLLTNPVLMRESMRLYGDCLDFGRNKISVLFHFRRIGLRVACRFKGLTGGLSKHREVVK